MVSNINHTIQKKRIITLDILRGLFLAIIAVDHFRQFPSLFDAITGRGMLWVSAAEGFFIISGIVVGYIYGSKMIKNIKNTTFRIWRRALLLYSLSIIFTLLFTVWGRFMLGHDGVKEGLTIGTSNMHIIIATLKLQYIYGWVDFLALYAVFMFIAPFALLAIVRDKTWLVVALSIAGWALLRGHDIRFGWQIFFIPAIAIGYKLNHIESMINKISAKKTQLLYSYLALLVIVMLAISTYFVFVVPFVVNRPALLSQLPNVLSESIKWSHDIYAAYIEQQFYKWTLPAGRVIFAWLWFVTLYLLVRRFEMQITKYSRNIFALLGRNSLFTYCTMGILIYGLHFVIVPEVTEFNVSKMLVNSIINSLLLTILYSIVYLKEKYAANRAARQLS